MNLFCLFGRHLPSPRLWIPYLECWRVVCRRCNTLLEVGE